MKSARASQMANGKIGTKAWGEFAPRNEWMDSGEHVVGGSEKDGRIQELGSFAELFEESLKSVEQGKVIEGEIVLIEQDRVLVDIGYKSEGQVPIQEFLDAEGNLTARVGDRIEVILEERENEQGAIFLSREKAANIKIWERIKTVHEGNGTVQGTITSQLKGGFCVDIGVRAFLPGSQVDLRPVQDPKSLIGTKHDFRILKYDRKGSNVVLSRRAILEEERASLRKATLSKLEDGMVLQGTVKNIADYGLFIDLGGIDGLVHRTDMSWGRVGHPSEMHQIGERVEVKVLHFDREKARVSLGIKQLSPDPWSKVEEAYPIGTRIKGRVVSMNDYGAFVELEPGVEGLIHISEMSWSRRVRCPSQILKVGDRVDVAVLNTDVAEKHIALSLKQATPNPWDIIEKKYPVGSIINGKIKSIADFGVFVPIREGIDGLVHLSDISWTRRIKHPSELYRENQDVKAVVLKIDRENERFSLGIKQLAPNPWDKVPEKYKAGTRVTGTVTNVTDFGLFVELEEGIEGLLHVSEMGSNGYRNPTSQYQVGDTILVRVIKVSREPRKIGLSLQTR